MLDVHPAHHAATTWRDFFVHIATIVLGLLIAVGLEQTVELVHRRHEAREARESIKEEAVTNAKITERDLEQMGVIQRELVWDYDLLDSDASNAQVLAHLNYEFSLQRRRDAAWQAAKVNGSLALISPADVRFVSYYYETAEVTEPTIGTFFNQMDTARALLERTKSTHRLTASGRQQLLTLTGSALGLNKSLTEVFTYQLDALRRNKLQ